MWDKSNLRGKTIKAEAGASPFSCDQNYLGDCGKLEPTAGRGLSVFIQLSQK